MTLVREVLDYFSFVYINAMVLACTTIISALVASAASQTVCISMDLTIFCTLFALVNIYLGSKMPTVGGKLFYFIATFVVLCSHFMYIIYDDAPSIGQIVDYLGIMAPVDTYDLF